MKRLIGLSLSICVIDILEDRVALPDVLCIISDTNIYLEDKRAIQQLLGMYNKHWKAYSVNEIVEILDTLIPIIYQPEEYVHTLDASWINLDDSITKSFF